MGLSPQLITDDLYVEAVESLKNLNKVGRGAIRLRAIVSAKEMGVELVARVFNITSNTLRAWVKSFRDGDLEGLDYKPGRGRKSNLQPIHLQEIQKLTEENNNITLNALVIKLQEKFFIKTSKSAVQRAIKSIGLSYITPRPQHHKQDLETHNEFKKKSTK